MGNNDPTTESRTERALSIDIIEGTIPGYTIINRRGVVPILSDSEFVDIGGANAVLVLPAAAGVVAIASTVSASDNATGTNLRTVTISGKDDNFDDQEEIVAVGASSLKLFRRVEEIRGKTWGTIFTNAGIVTATVGSDIQVTMLEGRNLSRDVHYTIPRGCAGYIGRIYVQPGSTKDILVKFLFGLSPIFFEGGQIGIAAGIPLDIDEEFGLRFEEKIDVRLQGITTSVGPDPLVYAQFRLIVIRYER